MAVPPPSLHLLVHHLPKHSVPDKLSFLLSHSFTTTMATLNAPHSSLPPPLVHAPTLPSPHIKTHLLGMLYTRSRMHQGSHTSPSLSLHPHSLILSLKHKTLYGWYFTESDFLHPLPPPTFKHQYQIFHFPMHCPLYFTLSETDHFSQLQSLNIFHDPRQLLLQAKESTED